MHKIDYDLIKNRLSIALSGTFTADTAKQCADEIIETSKNLHPGFDVITDISGLKVVAQELTTEIARAQAHLLSVGARKSVRVVTKENFITGMQFRRINSSIGLDSINVYSIEEAEEELAKD